MQIILAKTALAATVEFEIGKLSPIRDSIPATLFLIGTPDPGDSDDKIEIQFPDETNPAVVTWTTLKMDGVDQVLDKDTNVRSLYAPGKFRLNRPAGTAAIGVTIA